MGTDFVENTFGDINLANLNVYNVINIEQGILVE